MDNESSDIGSSNEDDSCENEQVQIVDSLPFFVMDLITAAASTTFSKTTVAPLERIKILLQVKYVTSLLFICSYLFFSLSNESLFQDYQCYILKYFCSPMC